MLLGYCPIGNGSSIEPFDKVFDEWVNVLHYPNLKDLDAVVFWGGQDIHSSLYQHPAHMSNQSRGSHPTERDRFEWALMTFCKHHKIPMIGVCRGAQLMCAFAGGSLIQHVTGHVGVGDHTVTTNTGEIFTVTSCHHQMMYPWEVPHELLAWSSKNLSARYEKYGDVVADMDGRPEPEIVYFPAFNGLAIQGHPEWAIGTRFAQYCNEQIQTKLLKKVEA